MIQAVLEPLVAQPERSGILLDFDGTLAPIVSRPDQVVPAPAATEVLRSLADRFGVVAVISGRPTEDLERFVGVVGLLLLRIVIYLSFLSIPGVGQDRRGSSRLVHEARRPPAGSFGHAPILPVSVSRGRTHLECPRQEEQAQLPHRYRLLIPSGQPIPPTAAKVSGLDYDLRLCSARYRSG